MESVIEELLSSIILICAGVPDDNYPWAAGLLTPFTALQKVASIVTSENTEVLDGIIEFFQPVALTLCLVYCVMTFFDNMAFREKEFTPIELCREIFRIVIGFAAITYSDKIASAILNTNNWVINNFSSGDSAPGISSGMQAALDSVAASITGAFWEKIIIIIIGAILLIVGVIGNLAVLSVYFSRKFELMLRCGFLPLALSEFYNDGMRSSGIRYMKKTAGCAMTVAAYNACDLIAIGMMGSAFGTIGSGCFAIIGAAAVCCMIKFVQVGAMSVAKNIMYEAFGS